jgi:hypothetical protein
MNYPATPGKWTNSETQLLVNPYALEEKATNVTPNG